MVAEPAVARPLIDAVPLRTDLFDEGPQGPRLVAGRCGACGAHFFPRRMVCARCLSREMVTVALSTSGTLYTYTTVHQSTPEFRTPYLLAYVDLPEGLRLLAPLAGVAPEDVRIGMALDLRVEPVRNDPEGRPVLGFRAYPAPEVARG